jgi:hypothetical protein
VRQQDMSNSSKVLRFHLSKPLKFRDRIAGKRNDPKPLKELFATTESGNEFRILGCGFGVIPKLAGRMTSLLASRMTSRAAAHSHQLP